MRRKNKQFPNYQDLYSFEDCKLVYDAKRTFCCGLSPICLCASSQHESINRHLLNEDSANVNAEVRTLRLEYAIRVWVKAALISADNPGPLLYYWWLEYTDNDTSFREIQYHDFYDDATPEAMTEGFWQLLEKIADSGEISVREGYSCAQGDIGRLNKGEKVVFTIVLDVENAHDAIEKIDDVFAYPYDETPRSFTWAQIKDLFVQLNLHQLSLIDKKQLHRHTMIDDMLFYGCSKLDIEWVKMAIRKGANVNALNDNGDCAITQAIEYYDDSTIRRSDNMTDEEYEKICRENHSKCIEIVDYLLECGADVDLFGVDGMQPVTSAYYAHSADMVKHLLEKGSDPNYNSYRCDDLRWRTEDGCQCTILNVINEDLDDEYDDFEKEVEELVHNHGGHNYPWDLDVARWEYLGRFYMSISPDHEHFLFFDNGGWGIGDEDEITIRDREDNLQKIKLYDSDSLRQWHKEFLDNQENSSFDWQAWNMRGRDLAHKLAMQLPDTVALFYPYGEQIEKAYDKWTDKYYLKTLIKEELID